MPTVRTVLASLLLVGSILLSGSGAAAKEGGPGKGSGKPPKARITWSTPRLEQTISPGQTVETTVTLTSSADLTDVRLLVPAGLRRIVTVEPATIASLKAGVATSVKLTMTMPASGVHTQGGVIQVFAGQRAVPSVLTVKLVAPRAANNGDTAEDGE
jgi:hypothetical protein